MNWNRLYRIAYLVLLVVGPLFALCYFMIALEGPLQQWAGVSVMAFVDQVLGAWGIVPPFVSWALLGFIVVTMIYFAIWEAHRIHIPKTRWFLLIAPWMILAVGPVVWPLVEVYFTRPAILAQPQGAPAPGEVNTIQGIELVWIPPGRFRMGSPSREPARENDERRHVVTLRYGFWMSRYEITRGQWEAVMGPDPSRPPQEPDEPVNGVLWQDCQDFLTKLNATQPRAFRLPTEAEWEYACRATTTGPYSFDVDASQLVEYAWFGENSGKKVHRVGQKAPNPWGAVRCARQCMGMVPRLVWAVPRRTRRRPYRTGLRNLPCNPRRRLEQPARSMPVRRAQFLHGRILLGQERPGLSDRSRPCTAGSSREPPCAARHAARSQLEPASAKRPPHPSARRASNRAHTLIPPHLNIAVSSNTACMIILRSSMRTNYLAAHHTREDPQD